MTVTELKKLKQERKISTSSNGDVWFSTYQHNSSTLVPSVSLSGHSEEFVVNKMVAFLDSVNLDDEESE